jgi:hypothetical protein
LFSPEDDSRWRSRHAAISSDLPCAADFSSNHLRFAGLKSDRAQTNNHNRLSYLGDNPQVL